MDLLDLDPEKEYQVDHKDLMRVFERRLKIPTYLKEQGEALENMVEDYRDGDTGKIKYKDLVETIKHFSYEKAEAPEHLEAPKSQHSMSSLHSDTRGMQGMKGSKTIFNDDYVVLDAQKVPPNTLEAI